MSDPTPFCDPHHITSATEAIVSEPSAEQESSAEGVLMDNRSHALIDYAAIALVIMAVAIFTMAVAFGWILGQ